MSKFTNPCSCSPAIRVRQQPEWGAAFGLFGYGVALTMRVHFGDCPLPDEVLHASAVQIATTGDPA